MQAVRSGAYMTVWSTSAHTTDSIPVWPDLPRAGHNHRGRGARRRIAPHHALRHRHDQVHLLRLLPGVVSRRRDRREPQRRVRDRDERGAAVQQGASALSPSPDRSAHWRRCRMHVLTCVTDRETARKRRQVGARAGSRHSRRCTVPIAGLAHQSRHPRPSTHQCRCTE